MPRPVRFGPPGGTLVAAVVVGMLAIVALWATGSVAGSNSALEVMGFDPDRASLITGLSVGAIAAAVAALVAGRTAIPILLSYFGFATVFGAPFCAETANALAATGPQGFTPAGWIATVVTLLVAGLATGWAAATLAIHVRGWISEAAELLVHRPTGTSRRRILRVAAPLVAVAVVAASVPTFADMINYTPDVAMTNGGIQNAPPLVGASSGSGAPGSTGTAAGGGDGLTSAGGGAAEAPAPGTMPRPYVSPGAIASTAPWASSPPRGHGQIITTLFPAPWVGGNYTSVEVWYYLPPGYATSAARYPVVYTVPWDLTHWQLGIHITGLLDQAIGAGQIPPEIVAFIDLAGGPFPNSECANSYDGREHADTFVSTTVVDWTDAHLRTIPGANARTVLGFSQGGFCAANLLIRHPTVFHQAVAFSGYFVAGLRTGETINAWMPWGRVPSAVAANSPMQTAAELAPSVRRQLFVVLSGEPDEPPFGEQLGSFARVLQDAGYPTDLLWNRLGHAWAAVKGEFVPALRAVAQREVLTGVLR